MGKQLVLAEKPSVGRDIARVLKCTKGSKAFIEGRDYIVTWAMGHLVQLAPPERYDPAFANWEMASLPMLPEHFKLDAIKQTSHQLKQVRQLIKRKDVDGIIIATDAGREGELVARWILKYVGSKLPVKRLWISSVTDKAIQKGFENLRDGKEYYNLYMSAVARSEADWLVGLNASRALTCKYNESLSCGRVQTPTLSIINSREEKINRFVPEKLFGIRGMLDNRQFVLYKKDKPWVSKDKSQVNDVLIGLKGKGLIINAVTEKTNKKYSDSLYDLTALQRDADARYGFSAKETLRTMQSLYETHKLLTYPRTDSRFLTDDIVETLSDRLRSIQVGNYKSFVGAILKQGIKSNKRFVDNSKVSDHHAIIPTDEVVDLKSLSAKEFKIYDLVVKRFLSILSPPAEYMSSHIIAEVDGHTFISKEEWCVSEGFQAIYGEKAKENTSVKYNVKSTYNGLNLSFNETLTSPPARFTEGLLLHAMEHPSSYMESDKKELKASLKASGGLGTVATRADIIEKLQSSAYVEKRGKYLYMTKKGKQLLTLVPNSLRTPAMTGEWEMKLKQIAEGQLRRDSFIKEMADYTTEIISAIKTSDVIYRHENVVSEKCPECGSNMFQKSTKHGKSIVCSQRSCGYRKQISKSTNARCPECHKKLNLVGEGDGRKFVCTCGYNEKLSTFEKRKKASKQQMGKRDVKKYLNKQKSDETFNNPFAGLLDKIED